MSVTIHATAAHQAPARVVVSAPRAKVEVRGSTQIRYEGREQGHGRVDQDRDHDRDRDRDNDRWTVRAPSVTVVSNPVYTYDDAPVYQPPVYQPPVYAPSFESISAPAALEGSSSRIDLDVTGRLTGMSTLELDATGNGSTYVQTVVFQYLNGTQTTVIPVNQNLGSNHPTFCVPLGDGSQIARVIVNGQSSWGGSIALNARA